MKNLATNKIYFILGNSFCRKAFYFLMGYYFLPVFIFAQTPTNTAEQQLENATENAADADIEDDSYLQQTLYFKKHPININNASPTDLKELQLLNALQIENFIFYKNQLGKFISIYELQAIPGWDIALIQKIKIYLTISNEINLPATLKNRLHGGQNSMLVRLSQTLEKSKGYGLNASSATNFYQGSPLHILVRYKYQFKNNLQYGIIGEKDAGEQFFKGTQKQGFDFYSAHFFVKNLGKIKSLALGDFTVNMGQGLTQWQSLAFTKSADVMNIKRQAEVLRPYNSAGEINFHRGVGITLQKNNGEYTLFLSYKKIDANFVADTSQNHNDFVSSLQTSGYHRTPSETADKGIQRQLAFGGNILYKFNRLQLGLNAIQYKFKLPLIKQADPYNLYALSGKYFGNYSINYSYTFKNMHLFGEAAATNNLYKAFVNGILISTSANTDMSFLYRNISKNYQSLYTSAFTENSYPTNEKGFYMGLSIHPSTVWRIEAYADFFKFPWLKYLVNAPTTGSDYLVQITYTPNKQTEMYSRFRSQSKSLNFNPDALALSPVVAQPKQSWRNNLVYKFNAEITLKNRVELLWFNSKTPQAEQGFLTYLDILYSPKLKSWSGGMRLQYFETDSYNSRLYAFENDVLYSYAIPVFFNKGLRYYVNANYDINKKITFWLRWAQTLYTNKTLIGTGLDEIKGNKKSEIKLQLTYNY